MASNFTDLMEVIVEKIEGLKDGSGNTLIQEVYDYGEAKFNAYPAAVVIEKGGSGEPIDTHRIERNFQFEVTLWQEQSRSGKTPEQAATIMRDCTDRVLKSFDIDRQLGGEADRVIVTDIAADFSVRTGAFNFARFTVNVRVIVPSFDEES